jgi:hypothetical protein
MMARVHDAHPKAGYTYATAPPCVRKKIKASAGGRRSKSKKSRRTHIEAVTG